MIPEITSFFSDAYAFFTADAVGATFGVFIIWFLIDAIVKEVAFYT